MHSDPIAPVIFGVTLILVAALIGRFTAHRSGHRLNAELVRAIVTGETCQLELERCA